MLAYSALAVSLEFHYTSLALNNKLAFSLVNTNRLGLMGRRPSWTLLTKDKLIINTNTHW
jgi:hypothetical protein